jgi:hypothetical protein
MDFTISIRDDLLPGIVAIAYAESTEEAPVTPEDVVARYAEAAAVKACQDMQVGPFYIGPTPPRFNQDGSPYTGE